jgi:hypothetical protein
MTVVRYLAVFDRTLGGKGYYLGSTVRLSKADSRVAPDDTKSKPKESELYEKGCSGRDLNPGSATRKSSILLI